MAISGSKCLARSPHRREQAGPLRAVSPLLADGCDVLRFCFGAVDEAQYLAVEFLRGP